VKPLDMKTSGLGIDRTRSGGAGTVSQVSQDTKGYYYGVQLDRKGKERKVITLVVRREQLVVHRPK